MKLRNMMLLSEDLVTAVSPSVFSDSGSLTLHNIYRVILGKVTQAILHSLQQETLNTCRNSLPEGIL